MADLTTNPTFDAFIASAGEVEAASGDADFRAFLEQALQGSGPDPRQVDVEAARYRLTDGQGRTRDLRLDDAVAPGGWAPTLRRLLAPQLVHAPERLVHALWRLPNFSELRRFVRAIGAVVRYTPPAPGDGPEAVGQVVLAETLLPMLASIERREYVRPNGDMASDGITRTLGLRAKVFAIDRARRAEAPEDASLLDRLTRTLVRLR